MAGGDAVELLLEFARQDDIGDAYALPERPTRYFLRQANGGYLEGVLRWNAALRGQLEGLRSRRAAPEDRQQIGRTLRRFLADFGWDQHEARIEAALAADQPVVITIRSAAAELFRLPWPLLIRGESDQHLGAHPQVLFRSEWPQTASALAPINPGPERVLVAWSAATRPVPWGRHVDAIERACTAGMVPFDRAADVLGNVTPNGLVGALRSVDPARPVSVLHLLCHGAAVGDVFGLGLDGVDGAPVAVDAAMLRELLSPFADRVRLVVVSACDAANDGPWDATLGSVAQALHRAGFAAVVAPRYPLSGAGSVTLTETLYRTLLERPSSLEDAVRATRRALATHHPDDVEWLSLQLYARAADGADTRPITLRPYRGLLPFGPEHVRFFFGRDAERAKTVGDLAALHAAGEPRFVVVAGASGTGKSSLVLAGVVTDLMARQRHAEGAGDGPQTGLARLADLLRGLLPGMDDPALRDGARRLLQAMPADDAAPDTWRVAVTKPGPSPLQALATTLDAQAGRAGALLLVVDQFEEVFTQGASETERDAYVRQLWQLAQATERRVDVVLTVRVDYLGQCGRVTVDGDGRRLDKVAYDERHRVFIPQLDPQHLREAIELPAARVGLSLETGLAERMLADVAGQPGALPLLQYTLDQLWQRRTGGQLTLAAYTALDGVTGALHGKANALIDGLTQAQQAQARRLLVRLVSVDQDAGRDTRRRERTAALRPREAEAAADFDEALEQLVAARLLYRDEATVEVAHEALIRGWTRLQRWLDADQDMERQVREVEAWVAESVRHKTLLRDPKLGYASKVLADYPGRLSPDAEARAAPRGAAAWAGCRPSCWPRWWPSSCGARASKRPRQSPRPTAARSWSGGPRTWPKRRRTTPHKNRRPPSRPRGWPRRPGSALGWPTSPTWQGGSPRTGHWPRRS